MVKIRVYSDYDFLIYYKKPHENLKKKKMKIDYVESLIFLDTAFKN